MLFNFTPTYPNVLKRLQKTQDDLNVTGLQCVLSHLSGITWFCHFIISIFYSKCAGGEFAVLNIAEAEEVEFSILLHMEIN